VTRRGWLVLATILTAIAWLTLPDPIFEIAVGVLVVIGSGVTAAYWYEQAIRAEADRIHAVFEAEGYRIDLRDLAEDHESLLIRLGEVLDEHSLCPAPIQALDFDAHTAHALTVVADLSNVTAFPEQRKAGETS
jgi:hypothetical protein